MARLSRRFRFAKQRPLAWSAFARHYWRSLVLMSFPPATEMFQFAGFASCSYGFTDRIPPKAVGCPIRRSRDHRALAPPPSFSQRATSFIASRCQGIHQMPFSCSPTPSPKAALRARREQRTEVRDQTSAGADLASASLSLLTALWSRCVSIAPPGHAPRRICIPMPRHDRSPRKTRGSRRPLLSCPLHGHNSLHDVKNDHDGPRPTLSGASRRSPSRLRAAPGAAAPSPRSQPTPDWWAWADLNGRPHAYQACALTS